MKFETSFAGEFEFEIAHSFPGFVKMIRLIDEDEELKLFSVSY